MNLALFFIPLISAVLGWLIHTAVARYMLQNYWPKKKNTIAKALAGWAVKKVSFTEIEKKIAGPDMVEIAMPTIEAHLDEFLNVKLQQEMPMLAMFAGTKTTDKIKEVFVNQVKSLFPNIIAQLFHNAKGKFDIEKQIYSALNEPLMQAAITSKLKIEFKKLPLLGLLAGFIIGLINLAVFLIVR